MKKLKSLLENKKQLNEVTNSAAKEGVFGYFDTKFSLDINVSNIFANSVISLKTKPQSTLKEIYRKLESEEEWKQGQQDLKRFEDIIEKETAAMIKPLADKFEADMKKILEKIEKKYNK